MTTIEERREIAANLRKINDGREGCGHELCCDLWVALGFSDCRCDEDCDKCEGNVVSFLADLIEPCDRDALLALAYEMSMDGIDGFLIPTFEYARRIREACGVAR